MTKMIGVDVGGTFTDVFVLDEASGIAEVAKVQWFRDEVEGTEFQSLNRGFNVSVRCNDGDGRARRIGLHPIHKFKAVAVRKSHVSEADIKCALAQRSLGARNISRHLGLHRRLPQRVPGFESVDLHPASQHRRQPWQHHHLVRSCRRPGPAQPSVV